MLQKKFSVIITSFAYNFNDCIKNFNEENVSHENFYVIGVRILYSRSEIEIQAKAQKKIIQILHINYANSIINIIMFTFV